MGQKNAYTTAMRRRAKKKSEARPEVKSEGKADARRGKRPGKKASSELPAGATPKSAKKTKTTKSKATKTKTTRAKPAEVPVVWPFEAGHSLDGVKLLEAVKAKPDMWLYRGRHTRLQKDVWLLAFSMETGDSAQWIKHAKQLASQGEWDLTVSDLSEAEGYGVVVIQEQEQALSPDDILSALRGRRHELPQREDSKGLGRTWWLVIGALIVAIAVGVVLSGGEPSSADRSVESMMGDDDWKIRREGMRVLAKAFSLEALAQVGPMVHDPHWRVRLAACEIMGQWARPEATRYLSLAALKSNTPSVRKAAQAAQAALARIEAANPKYP